MQLTDRIKQLADAHNMTFASLERAAGLGRGAIRRWDINCPAADRLLKVAELLGTSTDFLLTGKSVQSEKAISPDKQEWLDLVNQLPAEKQIEYKAEIRGYLKHMKESGEPVAADFPATGTHGLGK